MIAYIYDDTTQQCIASHSTKQHCKIGDKIINAGIAYVVRCYIAGKKQTLYFVEKE